MMLSEFHNCIQGILFDWGDTLVRPPGITTDEKRHFDCVESFFHDDLRPCIETSLGVCSIEWDDFQQGYKAASADQIRLTFETGREHSFEERILGSLASAKAPISLEEMDRARLAACLGRRISENCIPIEGAPELLARLRRRYRTGLLSNYPNADTVSSSLDRLGLLDHLDHVLISAEIGWAKPHPLAFEAAIRRLGLPAEAILFVGDDLENDMRGARQAGMRTAWLPRPGCTGASPFVEFTLGGLGDLQALLVGEAVS